MYTDVMHVIQQCDVRDLPRLNEKRMAVLHTVVEIVNLVKVITV